ncbi:hypothetical protein [Clostridium perfringens]|nr:hypothetical protein [Clostridium perfringens]MBI6054838.1 hypothetical protein [Clostridium perfringens]MDJ8930708.1 hypothetical protein [Clostridium perfringens]MDJ8951194.1 hypothetical protein [Clostridium perfringens]MDJ9043324.1 hypothetical protein [Clostridium perfringens]MDJ9050492.1 hypothetical protein [Clostridium perfringens]
MEYRNKEKSFKISARFLFTMFIGMIITFGFFTGKLDSSAIIQILSNLKF